MDIFAHPLVVLLASALVGVLGFMGAQAVSKLDFTSHRGAEQAAMIEVLNRIVTKLDADGDKTADVAHASAKDVHELRVRMGSFEDVVPKIVEVLDRMTRVEERQNAVAGVAAQVTAIDREQVAQKEQMRTVFRMLEDTNARMASLAEDTALKLYRMLEPRLRSAA